MALSARLESLQQRHGALEDKIAREMRSPLPDQVRVAQLKKQKLQIKDTIVQTGAMMDGDLI